MQTGQDLGVAVVIQTDAADQKLLVYLTHHRAGAPSLALRHGRGHSKPRTMTAVNLRRDGDKRMSICLRSSLESLSRRVSLSEPPTLGKPATGGTRNRS